MSFKSPLPPEYKFVKLKTPQRAKMPSQFNLVYNNVKQDKFYIKQDQFTGCYVVYALGTHAPVPCNSLWAAKILACELHMKSRY